MASNQGNQGGGNQNGGNSNRGFAAMDPERQREIASKGGQAAHQSGNAHEFTSEEARQAGAKSHGGGGNGGNSGGGNSGGGSGGNGGGNSGGTRGGTSEQHAEAGRQSHKNDR